MTINNNAPANLIRSFLIKSFDTTKPARNDAISITRLRSLHGNCTYAMSGIFCQINLEYGVIKNTVTVNKIRKNKTVFNLFLKIKISTDTRTTKIFIMPI